MQQHLVPPLPPPVQRPIYVAEVPSDNTPPKNGRLKLIALIISVISITAAAVAWATRSHEEIKDWTIDRDYTMKIEIEEAAEKYYVPMDDFVEVRTEQKSIKEKVDDIDKKVDEMHKLLMTGEKPRIYVYEPGNVNGKSKRRNQ